MIEGERSASSVAPSLSVQECLTQADFCRANRISATHYYALKRSGKGPRELRAGRRVLITPEANQAWRDAREREAADLEMAQAKEDREPVAA